MSWVLSIFILAFLAFKNEKIKHNLTKADKKRLIILIFIALITRFIWIFLTDNAVYADASARTLDAYRWAEKIRLANYNFNQLFRIDFLMPSLDWLPLQNYITGTAGCLLNEWRYTPRLITAVFGALTIIPLFKLSLLKFNKKVAYIAVLILSFYGYHIIISSVTLSEPIYIFFLIYVYYYIEKWHISDDENSLYPLAILICCICLLRYEGWLLSLLIVCFLPLIRKPQRWINYFYFLVITSLPIVFVFFGELAYGENPLRGILYSDYEVRIALNHKVPKLGSILLTYTQSYIPLTFLSFVFFILYYYKRLTRQELILHSLYLLPFIVFIYKILNGTLTNQSRYIVSYMVTFIPYLSYMAFLLYKRLTVKYFFVILGLYILVINSFLFFTINAMKRPVLRYDNTFYKSLYSVKSINKGHFYIDTHISDAEYNWMAYSKMPVFYLDSSFIKNKCYNLTSHQTNNTQFVLKKIIESDDVSLYQKNVIATVEKDTDVYDVWNSDNFNYLLEKGFITHLVLFPKGELSKYLNFKNQLESYQGKNFKCIFNQSEYMIYKIIEHTEEL